MTRVITSRVIAYMPNNLWQISIYFIKDISMTALNLGGRVPEETISIFIYLTNPRPTGIVIANLYLGPESFFSTLIIVHVSIIPETLGVPPLSDGV
jgi:hypothetical protein